MLETALRRRRSIRAPDAGHADAATARDWFARFEGAGLDGVIAKPLDAPYQPGKRAMLKIKHQRTADCVVAGFRWHKVGDGTVGSLLLGLFDDDGVLHHVGITATFTMERRRELAEELEPLRENALEGHPWAGWAEWAAEQEERGQRVPGATSRWNRGRDLSWEPLRPERVVRGRLRPPAGRSLPARHDLPALAARQAAGGLPLRPARDDGPLRAVTHLWRGGGRLTRLSLCSDAKGWVHCGCHAAGRFRNERAATGR